jgi:hypothetical protein
MQNAGVAGPQRIALVVAIGAIAIVVARTLVDWWFMQPDDGWFMEAPNSSVLYSPGPSSGDRIGTAAVWIGAIGIWLALSWRILSDRGPR